MIMKISIVNMPFLAFIPHDDISNKINVNSIYA